MINQILDSKSIQWIVSKSTIEKPYDDCDYIEIGFMGNLPRHMVNQIRAMVKKVGGEFDGDGRFSAQEEKDGDDVINLMIKFGSTRGTAARINFFFTREAI